MFFINHILPMFINTCMSFLLVCERNDHTKIMTVYNKSVIYKLKVHKENPFDHKVKMITET